MRFATHGFWRWVTWLSMIILGIALIFVALQLRSSRADTATLKETLAANQELSLRNRETLRELCRMNSVQTAIVAEDAEIRRLVLASGMIPPKLVKRWKLGVLVYDGFASQLAQQTACVEVTNP